MTNYISKYFKEQGINTYLDYLQFRKDNQDKINHYKSVDYILRFGKEVEKINSELVNIKDKITDYVYYNELNIDQAKEQINYSEKIEEVIKRIKGLEQKSVNSDTTQKYIDKLRKLREMMNFALKYEFGDNDIKGVDLALFVDYRENGEISDENKEVFKDMSNIFSHVLNGKPQFDTGKTKHETIESLINYKVSLNMVDVKSNEGR